MSTVVFEAVVKDPISGEEFLILDTDPTEVEFAVDDYRAWFPRLDVIPPNPANKPRSDGQVPF